MQAFTDLKDFIDDVMHVKYHGWGKEDSSLPGFVEKGRMQSGILEVKEPAVAAILDDLEIAIASVTKKYRRRFENRAPGERWTCIACNRSNSNHVNSCVCGYRLTRGDT